MVDNLRTEEKNFVGCSFGTISAADSNGAIVHYSPNELDSAIIMQNSLYLVDSGGQYFDGTTDTTRTIAFDMPS